MYYTHGTLLGAQYRQMHSSPIPQGVFNLMRKIKYITIWAIIEMKNFSQSLKGVREPP